MKNKTVAAWLAFLGGPLGLHRFYLHGLGDMLGWLLPIPTALGLYGVQRVQQARGAATDAAGLHQLQRAGQQAIVGAVGVAAKGVAIRASVHVG